MGQIDKKLLVCPFSKKSIKNQKIIIGIEKSIFFMKIKKFKYKYAITAKNSDGGTYYYVNSQTQGIDMIPNAYSMASLVNHKATANTIISFRKVYHKGLRDWKIEYRKFFIETSVAH